MKRLLYKTGVETRRGGSVIGYATLERASFPALATNDFVYLNSGGSGPPSRSVIRATREADDLLCGPAYLEGAGLFAHQAAARSRARAAASRLVGAGPDDVALTESTTHGMNLGVGAIDWKPGDEALSTATEHPGCLVPLHNAARRFGIGVNLLSAPVTPEKVEGAMTPRTRLVALSHVDWTNGEVLPLREICEAARRWGAMTLVDGAQSVGNVPVDAPATGADLYAFTGHKWVLGPEGMGALYVRPGCEVYSTNVGYASLADPSAFDAGGGYELRPDARRFESSTLSPALAAGLAAAAGAVVECGSAWFRGIRHRAELLSELLSEIPRVTLRSPRPALSGLVSFEVEGIAPPEAVERLLSERFVLRYVPGLRPCVRASTHLFNSEGEVEGLARAVGRL